MGRARSNIVNAEILEALGPNGILINVARGSVVDEEALIEALQTGKILAAGLDVFAKEPHVPEALLQMENVVLLPHIGTATHHTRGLMGASGHRQRDFLVRWQGTAHTGGGNAGSGTQENGTSLMHLDHTASGVYAIAPTPFTPDGAVDESLH